MGQFFIPRSRNGPIFLYSVLGCNKQGELQDYFKFWTVTKYVTHDETRKAGKVDRL